MSDREKYDALRSVTGSTLTRSAPATEKIQYTVALTCYACGAVVSSRLPDTGTSQAACPSGCLVVDFTANGPTALLGKWSTYSTRGYGKITLFEEA